MRLEKSSKLNGPCDQLLQEPITFPHKISQTFHESYQSNTAIVCPAVARFMQDSRLIIQKFGYLICTFWIQRYIFKTVLLLEAILTAKSQYYQDYEEHLSLNYHRNNQVH